MLAGRSLGLIPLIVVAVMLITAEYRRGPIRVADRRARRGPLLAAKAVVIGALGSPPDWLAPCSRSPSA